MSIGPNVLDSNCDLEETTGAQRCHPISAKYISGRRQHDRIAGAGSCLSWCKLSILSKSRKAGAVALVYSQAHLAGSGHYTSSKSIMSRSGNENSRRQRKQPYATTHNQLMRTKMPVDKHRHCGFMLIFCCRRIVLTCSSSHPCTGGAPPLHQHRPWSHRCDLFACDWTYQRAHLLDKSGLILIPFKNASVRASTRA